MNLWKDPKSYHNSDFSAFILTDLIPCMCKISATNFMEMQVLIDALIASESK